jgi:hypothetical protein
MRRNAFSLVSLLLVVSGVLVADRARACSVVREYLPPTNFELVATTDVIVLADVLGAAAGSEGVEHRVVRVLKGTGVAPGDVVRTSGVVVSRVEAGERDDFSRARPGAYRGGCIAHDYAPSRRYLLFLSRQDGRLDVRGTPFTRVNEEVRGEDDPWWVAVVEYVRIAKLGDRGAQREALEALRARGGGLAADVADHFARPTPGKPFEELRPMYEAAADAHLRSLALIAIGTGGDPAARVFMRARLGEIGRGETPVPLDVSVLAVSKYLEAVDDPEAMREAAALYVELGTGRKETRWALMGLLLRRAGPELGDAMLKALASADDEEAGRLGAWFARHPSPAAVAALSQRHRDRWEMWELTLARAGAGDEAVVAWAVERLAKERDEHRWIAVYVLARSPSPEADRAAGRIIAAGGPDRESLIQGYAEAAHALAAPALAALGARSDLTAGERKWLERTLRARSQSSPGLR